MGSRIFKFLNYLLDCIMQVIYSSDDRCIICAQLNDKDELICEHCNCKIKLCSESFYASRDDKRFKCFSISYYSGVMLELILRLKYKSDFNCGEVIANLMLNFIQNNKIEFDIVTFVPVSKTSYKKRGYNQTQYLAGYIGKNLNKPVNSTLLKVKITRDQIGLYGNERWNNIKDSFKINKKVKIKNKIILLVDDVITTGATVFYCANILKNNGAKEVLILTAAKSKV
jgi:competence protein ComFC